MNVMRMGLCCALVGWMAADSQAQLGTYGSPDPIPLGQYAPREASVPTMASRTSYVSAADGSGPSVTPAPAGAIPLPPSESSAVSSMLSEPSVVSPSSETAVLPKDGYIKEPGNCDACGDACGGGGCGCGEGNCCCSPWYASFQSLYMTRNQPRTVYTSADASNWANQGHFNDMNWTWGAQATFGYRFGCCCDWAVEGTYWGLAESDTDGGPGIPGASRYISPLIFGNVDMLGTTGGSGPGGAQQANAWTDQSPDHHTWRNWDAQDVEINFVKTVCDGRCNRFGVDFIAGVRWFRFQDGLVWGSERPNYNNLYSNDWIYLNDRITNDLVGGQLGFNASYRFADCWKVFVTPKFGVYDDHMTMNYNVYAVSSTTGQQFQGSSQTYANPNYPVHATTDGFAFLTQVDLGLDWQITRHISTQFGYRVVAATGVGLSDSQIPFYANDTQAIGNIQHTDSLLLHGAFGGLTFTW